jgi:hypothetical protein
MRNLAHGRSIALIDGTWVLRLARTGGRQIPRLGGTGLVGEEDNTPMSRKQLQFQTAARPGKRYFYMHALLTVFRRRRYNVPGWENDREQVFNGQIWATPQG